MRIPRPLTAAVVLLVLPLAALVLFRAPLAEAALKHWLADNGFPAAEVDVTEFGLSRFAIVNASLGEGQVQVRGIDVAYRLGELLGGRVRRIVIDGLSIDADVDEVRRLRDLVEWLSSSSADTGATTGAPVPVVDLRDARFRLAGLDGDPVELDLDAVLDVAGSPPHVDMSGSVRSSPTRAVFQAFTEEVDGAIHMTVESEGTSAVAGLPWPAGSGARPGGGEVAFEMRGTLPWPRDGLLPWSAVGTMADHGEVSARLDVSGLSVPGWVGTADGSIGLLARFQPDEVTADLQRPLKVDAADLSPALFELMGIADDGTADTLGRQVSIRASSPDGEQPLLRLQRAGDGWRGRIGAALDLSLASGSITVSLDAETRHDDALSLADFSLARLDIETAELPVPGLGPLDATWQTTGRGDLDQVTLTGPLTLRIASLRAGEGELRGLSYEGPVQAALGGNDLTAEASGSGRMAIEQLWQIGGVSSAGPVAGTVDSGTLRKALGEETLALALRLRPDVAKLRAGSGSETLDAGLRLGEVTLDLAVLPELEGDVGIRDMELDLRTSDIRVAVAQGVIRLAGDRTTFEGRGTIRSTVMPPVHEPVDFDVRGNRRDSGVFMAGLLTAAKKAVSIPFEGSYAPDAGQGTFEVGPTDLSFDDGGFRLADLSPAFRDLDVRSGGIGFRGTLDVRRDREPILKGRLDLDGVTAEIGSLRLEQLSGSLDFEDLVRPSMARKQRVTAERLVAGLPFSGIAAEFRLTDTGTGTAIEIGSARAELAGGAISVTDETVEIGRDPNALTIAVDELPLARLLEEIGTEDISGTGILSGAIPVEFGASGFSIGGGRLFAQEDGILNVDLGSFGENLMGQGEQVSLMVRALRDFHYNQLEIGIDRPMGGETALTLTIEGHNPMVLEGYPFRFNISLSGDLEPILAALREGDTLGTDLLRDALRVR